MAGTTGVPFLGRRAELERLLDAFEEVREGRSLTVALGGDAGMGKTRLVSELRERLREEAAHLLVGGSVDVSGGGLPLAPVAAAIRSLVRHDEVPDRLRRLVPAQLRPLVPELAGPGDRPVTAAVESGQVALFGSILGLLTELSRQGPLVLVLEDVHWADDSTRDLIPFLARHLAGAPVLVLVTYRTDELHRQHPLRPLLAELSRLPGARTVELPPLTAGEVEDLARAVAGGPVRLDLVDDLIRRSQGNPFAVEELVQAHLDGHVGLPSSIVDLLLLRLDAVEPATLDALRLIAVVGRPVPHELLEVLSDRDGDELDAAVRDAVERHLLVVDEGRYTFRHALLSEAIDGTLLPGERRRLHRHVAETLTAHPALGSASAPLSELAHHWHLAGDVEASVAAAAAASVEAEATPALREAARLVERVLEHWDDVEHPEALTGASRIEHLARAAQLRYLASDGTDALRLCRAALDLVDEASDPVTAGLLHERLGRYMWSNDAPPAERIAVYERATELVPAEPATPERARVLAAHGQSLMLMQRFAESVDRCREALEVAGHTDSLLWEVHARNTLGTSLCWLGETEQGLAELEAARAAAADTGYADEICRVAGNSIECLRLSGRLDEAAALAEETFVLVERFGLTPGYAPMMAAGAADALVLAGRWDDAMTLVARYRWPDNAYGARWLGLAATEVALGRGDVEAAAAYLADADAARASVDVQTRVRARIAHARLAALRGATAAALGHAEALLEDLAVQPAMLSVTVAAEAVLLLHDLPGGDERDRLAEGLAHAGRAAAAALHDATPPITVDVAAAILEAVRAGGPDAAAAWGQVAELADGAGLVPVAASARARRAEALVEAGEPATAEEVLRAALDAARGLGATPIEERVRVTATRARIVLDDRGSAADRAGGAAAPNDLTPRELEVLALVAQGLTNPEIGRELYISEKTASVHVSRILRKLEVSNRVEAAIAAQRLGIGTTTPA